MRTTGRAVLFTTAVLTCAFSIYGFATAESVAYFGLLTAWPSSWLSFSTSF
jgi:hypothetical protein